MSDNIKLKPCTFCGGEAHLPVCQDSDEIFGWAQCLSCEADGAPCKDHNNVTGEEAAKAWNTRHGDTT